MTYTGPVVTTVAIGTTSAGADLEVNGDITVTGDCTANAYHNSSDASLKEDIRTLDAQACEQMLLGLEAKIYKRKDLDGEEDRCGFLAQDVEKHLPGGCHNVIGHSSSPEGQSILTLDYGRLSAILWQICRSQQQNINDLTARLTALEKPKTKSKKSSD